MKQVSPNDTAWISTPSALSISWPQVSRTRHADRTGTVLAPNQSCCSSKIWTAAAASLTSRAKEGCPFTGNRHVADAPRPWGGMATPHSRPTTKTLDIHGLVSQRRRPRSDVVGGTTNLQRANSPGNRRVDVHKGAGYPETMGRVSPALREPSWLPRPAPTSPVSRRRRSASARSCPAARRCGPPSALGPRRRWSRRPGCRGRPTCRRGPL